MMTNVLFLLDIQVDPGPILSPPGNFTNDVMVPFKIRVVLFITILHHAVQLISDSPNIRTGLWRSK